ncbi:hypothetical protein A2165_04640 [Candidatus Curtissbacteria bacterium RBG_13_40_7]|uniref:Uncharacterized protein n=1 Tax=Candidatus Curtissbacteria bacterium RBG_13_40_7 TaxID=1797706 RepID=A0A1F5FYX9_9BACT|nr:MAG: hypothetical protein A2165_04640 [Candidatus Curtissbacteria bacterium RBG_13_40_7]
MNFKILFLIVLIVGVIFGLYNWQRTGRFFGFSFYNNVDFLELLSFANLHDGKKICTKGLYFQDSNISILRVSLDDDQFTRSAWIVNPTEKDIILQSPYAPKKSVQAQICGLFQSSRAGSFGEPPVWNHQITVEKFKTFGVPQIIQ